MTAAFKCRIQYNSDIPKIRKFFEETETLNFAAGEAGIALLATTQNEICYYIVEIHKCDIYQLQVNRSASDIWSKGGVIRTLPAISFINFIKNKEVNDDLQFEIDDNATELKLSVMDGMNTVRSIPIALTIPKIAHEYPPLSYANVVIKVNEFKKLCSDMAKASTEIRIRSQEHAIRLDGGDTSPVTHGTWVEGVKPYECFLKNVAFIKATKINIGNTKNSQAGIYVYPGHPVMIKVKLGIVDFIIYSKVWVEDA